MFKESISALIVGVEVKDDNILLVAIFSLVINLISFKYSHGLFEHGCISHGKQCSSHSHHNNHNSHSHDKSHKHNHRKDSDCSEHDDLEGHCHSHNNKKNLEAGMSTGDNSFNEETTSKKSLKQKLLDLFLFDNSQTHQQNNLRSMLIHMLFDIVSAVAVILSCILIKAFNFCYLDPICSLMTSIVLFYTAFKLSKPILESFRRVKYDFSVLINFEYNPGFNEESNRKCLLVTEKEGKVLYVDIRDEIIYKKITDKNKVEFCISHSLNRIVINKIG